MKKIYNYLHLWLLAMLGVFAIPMYAQDFSIGISPSEIDINSGGTAGFTITFSNPDKVSFSSFETKIDLPEGISIERTTISTTLENLGFEDLTTENYIILTNMNLIPGDPMGCDLETGDLLTVILSADTDIDTQTSQIIFNEVLFVLENLTEITLPALSLPTVNINISGKDVEATSVTLDKSSLDMIIGDSEQLTATVMPENTTDKTIDWTSSDTNVATVDASGLIMAVGKGTAIITARCYDAEATCSVNVSAPAPSSISLSLSNLELKEGETAQLEYVLTPAYAETTLDWSSSDSKVATVSDSGLVTAVAEGQTTITVTTANNLTATATVNVSKNVTEVTAITVSPAEATVEAGKTVSLTATVTPTDATDMSVNWTTSDASIATVENGVVTGVKKGEVTITATASNGMKATAKITVTAPAPTEVRFDVNDLTLKVGETGQLSATLTPADAETSFTWKSADTDIATVSNTGLVTAVAEGQTTITVTTANNLTATATVTVSKNIIEVTGITVSPNQASVEVGETVPLTATVTPTDATDKTVTWRTSDASIATVENGVVTGVKKGEATITATASNGMKATAKITVTAPAPTEVKFDVNDLSLKVGETGQLSATLTPADAESTFTWKSADTDIATVSNTGLVTAVAEGQTTITVTTANNLTATATVTVSKNIIEVTGITVSPAIVEIMTGQSLTMTATITPADATDKTVTWTSSDPSVATVSESGLVYAVAEGNAVITAITSNGLKATASVTVSKNIIEVESITIIPEDAEIAVGETATFIAIVTPENATNKNLSWLSTDILVATVEDGVVTGVANGMVTITAIASNGKYASAYVTVTGDDQNNPGDDDPNNPGDDDPNNPGGDDPNNPGDDDPNNPGGDDPNNPGDDDPNNPGGDDPNNPGGDDPNNPGGDNPGGNYSPINIETSGLVWEVKTGTDVSLWVRAEGGNPEGWSFSWSDVQAGESISFDTDVTVTAYNPMPEPVVKEYLLKAVNADEEDILFEGEYLFSISVWGEPEIANGGDSFGDGDDDEIVDHDQEYGYGNADGVYVTALKLREGDTLGLYAKSPEGGYNYEWDFTWSLDGGFIADTQQTEVIAGAEAGWSGTEKRIEGVRYTVDVDNYGPGGNLWYSYTFNAPEVDVYSRPQTPSELLRKGDGTSCTFIVMSDLSYNELTTLGYTFVFGYSDSTGHDHEIDATPLRYCHTTRSIYNDPGNTFWVYSAWTFEDGSVVSSGKRYLDGSVDEGFNASDFSGEAVSPRFIPEEGTAVYTVEGQYMGNDASRLVPGIYIIKDGTKTRKIIVK